MLPLLKDILGHRSQCSPPASLRLLRKLFCTSLSKLFPRLKKHYHFSETAVFYSDDRFLYRKVISVWTLVFDLNTRESQNYVDTHTHTRSTSTAGSWMSCFNCFKRNLYVRTLTVHWINSREPPVLPQPQTSYWQQYTTVLLNDFQPWEILNSTVSLPFQCWLISSAFIFNLIYFHYSNLLKFPFQHHKNKFNQYSLLVNLSHNFAWSVVTK